MERVKDAAPYGMGRALWRVRDAAPYGMGRALWRVRDAAPYGMEGFMARQGWRGLRDGEGVMPRPAVEVYIRRRLVFCSWDIHNILCMTKKLS